MLRGQNLIGAWFSKAQCFFHIKSKLLGSFIKLVNWEPLDVFSLCMLCCLSMWLLLLLRLIHLLQLAFYFSAEEPSGSSKKGQDLSEGTSCSLSRGQEYFEDHKWLCCKCTCVFCIRRLWLVMPGFYLTYRVMWSPTWQYTKLLESFKLEKTKTYP